MKRWRRSTQSNEATVCAEVSAWLSQLMDEDRQLRIAPDDLRARAARLHDQVRQLATTKRAEA